MEIIKTTWEIPDGIFCHFVALGMGKICPFLRGQEYSGSGYCVHFRRDLHPHTERQTFRKCQLCLDLME